jgi:hypothetical protein
MKWGFDTTHLGDDWPTLRDELGLTYAGRTAGAFYWYSPGLWMVTTCNPETGEYWERALRASDPGFCGYVGLEGQDNEVTRAVDAIKRLAAHVKGESPSKRDFV